MNGRQTVTMIGWIWVGLGALAFVSGVGAFLVSSKQSSIPPLPFPVRSAVMDFMWQHYHQWAAIQIVLAVFIVFTSVMLLRRQLWAKFTIQFFSAAFLTWIVLFGIFWLRIMSTMASSDSGPQFFFLVVRIFMSVAGIATMGTFAFACGLCIWALSRPAVREEFRK
jgi:uncharacterized membrane protein